MTSQCESTLNSDGIFLNCYELMIGLINDIAFVLTSNSTLFFQTLIPIILILTSGAVTVNVNWSEPITSSIR